MICCWKYLQAVVIKCTMLLNLNGSTTLVSKFVINCPCLFMAARDSHTIQTVWDKPTLPLTVHAPLDNPRQSIMYLGFPYNIDCMNVEDQTVGYFLPLMATRDSQQTELLRVGLWGQDEYNPICSKLTKCLLFDRKNYNFTCIGFLNFLW